VRQLLERVRSTTIGAQAHQDLPFEQVVDIAQPSRSLSHSPLFQVMLAWQSNEQAEWSLPGIQAIEADTGYGPIKFDLELHLCEFKDEIHGAITFSTALFDRPTMERQAGYLVKMLEAMATDVERIVTAVDLLAQEEYQLLLRTWNDTKQEYPAHLCIHHLFEQQVERTPQATALVFMDQSMTYAELNGRANRLALLLVGLGVQPDTLVAICVERSLAMVIGVLAILKAGGAYVPLDPSYASDRLRDIMTDAAPTVVIVDKTGRLTLGEEALCSVAVVDPNGDLDVDHTPTR
jgi:non-ribosomal peptide synthetase component F